MHNKYYTAISLLFLLTTPCHTKDTNTKKISVATLLNISHQVKKSVLTKKNNFIQHNTKHQHLESTLNTNNILEHISTKSIIIKDEQGNISIISHNNVTVTNTSTIKVYSTTNNTVTISSEPDSVTNNTNKE